MTNFPGEGEKKPDYFRIHTQHQPTGAAAELQDEESTIQQNGAEPLDTFRIHIWHHPPGVAAELQDEESMTQQDAAESPQPEVRVAMLSPPEVKVAMLSPPEGKVSISSPTEGKTSVSSPPEGDAGAPPSSSPQKKTLFVYSNMAATEEAPSLPAAIISSVLGLSVPPPVPSLMLELYRLQAAVLRRRKRELAERDRRRRQYLRRRRAFLLSSVVAIMSLISGTTSRLAWIRKRTSGQNFWATAEETFDDDAWKAQFRVTRATFDYLVKLIGPAIKRPSTNSRVPVEPRRRLAIALWWFGQSVEYHCIAEMFGVSIASVCRIVRQVTQAIVERLYRRFVSLPSGRRLDDTIRGFKERCYPQCGGAIGGTHIPIAAPRDHPEDYLNVSGWHSVVLQAVVDHQHCFTDVDVGRPGNFSTSAVLSSSDLYLKAEDGPDGHLFPTGKSLVVDGVEIPVHLIGDTSFPLRPWLMKGYGDDHRLSHEQRRFTYALSAARSVVDGAFARLKGRWRCLLRKVDLRVSVAPKVVAACCVLHNVCQRRRDTFLLEWSTEPALSFVQLEANEGDACCAAEMIRHAIAYNLLTVLQQ
ncbi:putative nuclease HARBI1 [Pholidichthys leucotaenia]